MAISLLRVEPRAGNLEEKETMQTLAAGRKHRPALTKAALSAEAPLNNSAVLLSFATKTLPEYVDA
ncbi:hypothetical protein [Desulfosoma sp.]